TQASRSTGSGSTSIRSGSRRPIGSSDGNATEKKTTAKTSTSQPPQGRLEGSRDRQWSGLPEGPDDRGRNGHRRLGRRAHRRKWIAARLPVPQGAEGNQLVLHARFGDLVRVRLAGGYGRVPGDVLRPLA